MLGTSSGGRGGFPGCDNKQMWGRLVVAAYTRTPARPRRLVVRLATPGFRVGVLAVVFRPDGRLLLVDQPYNPGWALPGGDLRRGEGPDAGLARELREEIGLQVTAPQGGFQRSSQHLSRILGLRSGWKRTSRGRAAGRAA